ncbi:F0F1 ATP synthase subunit A [Falsirhodobacter halotolerans]|uniref:F0F1 ATP synthase subunit A n=1 Tax=Falsirhodobacter halotolerans TaxID=1146892 RepID=UPI0024589608|nr:F0F1 ATP synthase subunit A [Falsirhodobacter halotolerans]
MDGVAVETDGSGFKIDPMGQFVVRPLFSDGPIQWYTVTNVTLWLALAVVCVLALMVLGTRRRAMIPTRSQSVAEMAYGLIHNMVHDVVGKDGAKYFPYIMTLFLFVLFANLLGLVPASFTTTSHVAVTATLALMVFVSVTVIGFVRKGPGFLKLFWVEAAPLPVRPILAVIELISYFVRPVSHSVRLAGTMMAGHAVLKVFAGFASIVLISPVAIGAVTAIYGLELLVSLVQAYVFTILTCVYLRDAVGEAHH